MNTRSIVELFRNFALSLRTQVAAGFVNPLGDVARLGVSAKLREGITLFDESPGRICRNGYGSLEVGGLRDRADD
jgi:hypothetical protein